MEARLYGRGAECGRIARMRGGHPDDAYRRLVTEAERIRDRHPAGAVTLLIVAFSAAVFAGRAEDGLTAIEQVLTLQAVTPPAYAAYTRCAYTIMQGLMGRAADLADLDEVVAELPISADVPHELLPLLNDLVYGYTVLDGFEQAARLRALLIEVAQQRSAPGLTCNQWGCGALADFRLGEWTRAWAGALESERLASETGLDIDVANNRQLLALIAAARGRRDECLRYADLVLRQTRPAGAVVFELLISGTLGLLELGDGRPDRAIEPLERARALAARTGLREAGHFHGAADLVDAYVRCGRRDAALPLVRELEDQAQRTRRPTVAALAARCRGMLEPNGDHYDRALAWHAMINRPFETAQTRLAYGQSLRRQRRRATARVQLRAAWEIFGSLGATSWTEQARRELEAAGVTVGARPLTGADLLTPQELRVALEVAEGASNRQVAERLFLSAKTVEYHLGHVYQKLSIASRTDLGTALRALRKR